MGKILAGILSIFISIGAVVNDSTLKKADSLDYITTLTYYEIVDADDLRADELLTYRELFETMVAVLRADTEFGDTDHVWKYSGFKKILGEREEWQMKIIIGLSYESIISDYEWLDIDFSTNCTKAEALKYCMRAVAQNYDCVHTMPIYDDTAELYSEAYNRGVIKSADMSECDEYITRGEFFEIIDKILFTEYASGHYGGVDVRRLIDRFEPTPAPTPSYEKRVSDFMAEQVAASAEEKKAAFENSAVMPGAYSDVAIVAYYTLPRTYDNENAVINGNVFVDSTDIFIKNTVINGNLYISANADERYLAFDNVHVNGAIVFPQIRSFTSQDEESVFFIDCSAKDIVWEQYKSSKLVVQYRKNDSLYASGGSNMKLNEDFSITWDAPENVLGYKGQGLDLRTYDDSGNCLVSIGSSREAGCIETYEVLEFILDDYPVKTERIEIVCGNREPLVLDLKNVTVTESGEPLVPDKLTGLRHVNLSLKEGEFKEGHWYLITSRYEDPYEYGKVIATKREVFLAESSGMSVVNENMPFGKDYAIVIQEITVEGNAKDGFNITITPESETCFEIVDFNSID